MWKYVGKERPPFADEPKPGQESVWDYPRPPIIKESNNLVEVSFKKILIAESSRVYRLLETASPPGYYLPPDSVNWNCLSHSSGRSFCEWKGVAKYWKLSLNLEELIVGWSYPDPNSDYLILKDYVSFYPGRIDCFVNGQKVRPQPGQFYGGWLTDDIVGPVKGASGTGHW